MKTRSRLYRGEQGEGGGNAVVASVDWKRHDEERWGRGAVADEGETPRPEGGR